jgi:hypothetical protein
LPGLAVIDVNMPTESLVATLYRPVTLPSLSAWLLLHLFWKQGLLALLPDVVNFSKQLPDLPIPTDVHHFIKTSGPPISSKFRCQNGEKPVNAEFSKLEGDGVIHRPDSP